MQRMADFLEDETCGGLEIQYAYAAWKTSFNNRDEPVNPHIANLDAPKSNSCFCAHTFNMGDAKYFRMGGVRKTSHGIPLRYEDVSFELHNIAYTIITEITQMPRKAALTGAGDKKLF
jgi:hypothetical protein